MPVTSYTPTRNYPSFSTQVNEVQTITSSAVATGITLPAAAILGGFIIHTPTGAVNDTTDTAANIIAAIEGAQVGSRIFFTLRNKAGSAVAITLVGGAGVTINAGDTATVAQNNQKTFMLIVTAMPDQFGNGGAVAIYSQGTVVY